MNTAQVKALHARQINYRRLIDSLVRKPQAFRSSSLRAELMPTPDYQYINDPKSRS